MKSRYLIIPILIIALIGMIAAPPPAKAELVTISVILAAAFASAIIANEAINNETETDSAMNPGDSSTKQYASDGSRELSSTQPQQR